MLKKAGVLIVLCMICMFLSASSSWAGCLRKNLTGTWAFHVMTSNDVDFEPGTGRGTIVVNSSGAVKSGTSFIAEDDDRIRVTGGRFKIASSCAVSGYVIINDSGATARVNFKGTMNKSKDMMTGVLNIESRWNDVGLFTAVKK